MTEPVRVGEVVAGALEAARGALAGRRVPAEPDRGMDPAEAAATLAEMSADRQAAMWARVCPRRFRDVTWAWVAGEHGVTVCEQLQAWAGDPDPGNLLLLGPVGTGKTAAALLACRAGQLERGQGVAFHSAPDLFDLLRPGGPDGALERMQRAPRLIVDDLGAERPTDWTAERLGQVVNARWMNELPTVGTSNLAPADLREALGERTYSRLVHGALVLSLGGHDRRRHHAS